MNIKQQLKSLLVLELIAVTALTALIPTPANAGILDWIGISKEDTKNITASFDRVYNDIKDSKNFEEERNFTPVFFNSITSTSNPVAPVSKKIIKKTHTVELSAYSSTVDQTDDTPFITAKGTHVRDGIVATNFLPFGTRIKIPDIYGDKIFIVEDRMNKRYVTNVDIWFADRETALKFGRKKATIEIVSL